MKLNLRTTDKVKKIIEKTNNDGFSFFNGDTGIIKSMRSIEKKAKRYTGNFQVFYDSKKKKGVVFCKNKPKIKNKKLIMEF